MVSPWTKSLALGSSLLAALAAYTPDLARACGCTSPPVPQVSAEDFAVNQRAEQIIFEVGEDSVTAHVLIRYSGQPDEFAWIVPVPNVPDLALSETFAFPILDDQTGPTAQPAELSLCPSPEYRCMYHESCYDPDDGDTGGGDGGAKFDAGDGSDPGDGSGVDVLDQQVIGSYETVTFAASDADLAVQWLQDNGFIVNDTMTPFMEPYIQADMVFVAAKLVAGAGVDEIRPLQITYAGTKPMIPLRLTAVAADPHLTVTAFIYGQQHYKAIAWPEATIDPDRITTDRSGRTNYPMVLARSVDEAGGHAFVTEFAGEAPWPTFGGGSGCRDDGGDWCGIGFDGVCQCPNTDWDQDDCGSLEGLPEGIALLETLAEKHPYMTRLTTRVSPEEMSMDPAFDAFGLRFVGKKTYSAPRYSLDGCGGDVIDADEWADIDAKQACAAVYCGQGTCVVTDDGPGCACDAGYVAQMFQDVDGEPSITCAPETPPVDLGKDVELPDACAGLDCGNGSCVELGGFPACACDGASAAVVPAARSPLPRCVPTTVLTSSRGAENFSATLSELDVCAPAPPDCGPGGWLVKNDNKPIQGVVCASSLPDVSDLTPPPEPDCDTGGYGTGGFTTGGTDGDSGGIMMTRASCACTTNGTGGGLAFLGLALLGLARRRRA